MISHLASFVKNEVEALNEKGFDIALFVTAYRKSPNEYCWLEKYWL